MPATRGHSRRRTTPSLYDRSLDNRRDHATPTLYTPAKGLYDSADPAVIAEQMAEARSAGIDLFVVSYWDTENPPLAQYLDAASKVGIEIIEPTTAFGTHWLDLTKEEGALFCRGELGSLLQGAP